MPNALACSGTPRRPTQPPVPSTWWVSISAIVSGPLGAVHREVDRLPRHGGQVPQLGIGQRQHVVAGDAALGEPQQHRARVEAAALAGALEQAGALERSRAGAKRWLLGSPSPASSPTRAARRLDHAHEQLGGAVDRLGAGCASIESS